MRCGDRSRTIVGCCRRRKCANGTLGSDIRKCCKICHGRSKVSDRQVQGNHTVTAGGIDEVTGRGIRGTIVSNSVRPGIGSAGLHGLCRRGVLFNRKRKLYGRIAAVDGVKGFGVNSGCGERLASECIRTSGTDLGGCRLIINRVNGKVQRHDGIIAL